MIASFSWCGCEASIQETIVFVAENGLRSDLRVYNCEKIFMAVACPRSPSRCVLHTHWVCPHCAHVTCYATGGIYPKTGFGDPIDVNNRWLWQYLCVSIIRVTLSEPHTNVVYEKRDATNQTDWWYDATWPTDRGVLLSTYVTCVVLCVDMTNHLKH